MTPATLKSVAKATGFSITTVSRALGGFDDVSEDTRQRILEEARRQGYKPNEQARALQRRRSQTLGLIVPSTGPRFPDPFFSEFVSGVGTAASAAGFDLLLSTHTPLEEELETYRRMVAGRRVDGLILMRARYADERIAYLSQTDMPFVVYGRTTSTDSYLYIDVDGVAGQQAITRHVIELGHQRIAYITAPQNLMFARFRLQGFQQAMQQADLPIDEELIVEGDLTERGGMALARHLLGLPAPPTAILTGNDSMAFGVMSAIQERGLQVGRDIAVGGFDDVPLAEHIHPGLTTIHQPIHEAGQRVTQIILRKISGQSVEDCTALITPELIIRASSGPRRS